MSDATTAVVDIDKITVEEGHNPRANFDAAALAELEASIRKRGIVTALTVREDGNGGYIVVAGERRLIAATSAGLTRVPVLIRSGDDALSAAIAENLIRADLDPIEAADALARLAKAENITTNKALGARVGKSAGWVGERLRLLDLPAGTRTQIASGAVPIAAEANLRAVAKVSPRIAECVCEYVERGEVDGRELLTRFGEILLAVARAEFDPAPTMIPLDYRVHVTALVEPGDKRDELIARMAKTKDDFGYQPGDDPTVSVVEDDSDAARAAGCLVEYEQRDGRDYSRTFRFVTDRELAADLAERMVERAERASAERQARRAGGSDQDKDDRRKKLAKAKKDAQTARPANLSLGRRLIERRGAKSRQRHALKRAKAIAIMFLYDNDRLAGAGLRLVLPQLQEVTVSKLKTTGETREKIAYAESDQALDYLMGAIDRAKSANEVLELLADAVISAHLADERELPQSRRVLWHHRCIANAMELLAEDIAEIKPRKRRQ